MLPTPYALTKSALDTLNYSFFFFLYHLNSKMKSAVMAIACAAGAQAFVTPRSVMFERTASYSSGVVDLSPRALYQTAWFQFSWYAGYASCQLR